MNELVKTIKEDVGLRIGGMVVLGILGLYVGTKFYTGYLDAKKTKLEIRKLKIDLGDE